MAAIYPIATVTVPSGGQSSIDFTSIPGTYTDLIIKLSARSAQSSNFDFGSLRFNGSTANYSNRELIGTGSAASSANTSAQNQLYFTWVYPGGTATASTFNNMEIYIPNYAGSTNKSVSIDAVPETNATAVTYTTMSAGLWADTSAITSIKILVGSSQNFAQYTTATLYGIK